MSDRPTVGDRIRLNSQSGEAGEIIKVVSRKFRSPLYKVRWDDPELGTGVLYEHEFTDEAACLEAELPVIERTGTVAFFVKRRRSEEVE